jgi:hypothetical protein
MMQFKDDEEEDDYVVEGRDPEGDEDKFQEEKDDDDEPVAFDAESTLVWWRGAPYTKIQGEVKADGDEDFKVLDENIKIVEGTWRRMFEVDMREDEQDFNSKLMEAEMKVGFYLFVNMYVYQNDPSTNIVYICIYLLFII